MSACRGRAEVVPRSACHEPDMHDDPRRLIRRLVRHARFSSRGCPLGMRACTRVRVLYMISYRVYTFTKLNDRCIPKVGVGVRVCVGPIEFQLIRRVRADRRTERHQSQAVCTTTAVSIMHRSGVFCLSVCLSVPLRSQYSI